MPRLPAAAKILAFVASLGLLTTFAPQAKAQTQEERFQDLFVTAGYAAAFGAALGTAVLFLNPNVDPAANLRYIAMGASMGFIGGSIMGGYIIFSPMLADDAAPASGSLATGAPLPAKGLVVRPTYDPKTRTVTSVEGGMTLARF